MKLFCYYSTRNIQEKLFSAEFTSELLLIFHTPFHGSPSHFWMAFMVSWGSWDPGGGRGRRRERLVFHSHTLSLCKGLFNMSSTSEPHTGNKSWQTATYIHNAVSLQRSLYDERIKAFRHKSHFQFTPLRCSDFRRHTCSKFFIGVCAHHTSNSIIEIPEVNFVRRKYK